MLPNEQNQQPPSKHGRHTTKPWELTQRATRAYQVDTFLDFPKLVAWGAGMVLMEYRVTRQRDSWRVMVKAVKGSTPYVAFVNVPHWDDSLDFVSWLTDQGGLSWKPDSYPVSIPETDATGEKAKY